jgi:hypothetical protein
MISSAVISERKSAFGASQNFVAKGALGFGTLDILATLERSGISLGFKERT